MISNKNILISGIVSGLYFIILFSRQAEKIESPLPGVFFELFTIPMIILQFLTLIYFFYLLIKKIRLPVEFYITVAIATVIVTCVFILR